MDAIEFSPVYNCLADTKLFDQFTSKCTDQCSSDANMANAQCVRKAVVHGATASLTASWHLYLDCDNKCWSDTVPVSQHMGRLALADHFDITFQEVKIVSMRKDPEHPATHALLNVTIQTDRLASGDVKLLATFLDTARMASALLGLKVHDVVQINGKHEKKVVKHEKEVANVAISDSNMPGESSDQYR